MISLRPLLVFLPLLATFVSSLTLSPQEAETRCQELSRQRFQNTTILNATFIPSSQTIMTPGSCQSTAQVDVPLCRISMVTNTTRTSAVHAEVWLPNTWFGRTLTLGNGGLGGCIDYTNLQYGTDMNFAVVSGDNGHDGNSGSVFLNHPEVINDFAFRAVHTTVVIGRQIMAAYYRTALGKSYYLGCSTGGRQATQSALLFPEDYDGIVGGSPATDFNHLQGWSGLLSRFVGGPSASTSPSFIPLNLWNNLIAPEILRQCDDLDGLTDGIITEPDACIFRPETIQCTDANAVNSTTCVTAAQVDALKNIYTPIFGMDGQLIYPRLDPGAEGNGNSQALLGGPFLSFVTDWFKFTVFNNSNHNFSNFGLADIALADKINPGGIATFDGNMSAFLDRGGKFLTYHGRRDQLIASGNSKRVYDLIARTLSMPTLDPFYRLFLIPGMNHCSGGPGAYKFGQSGGVVVPPKNDSDHNILLAIVDWVENGVAPDTIVGTADSGDERVHCRYPVERSVLLNGTTFGCVQDG